MQTQSIHRTSGEVRAPYYVGIADLDELINLWARARVIDEAIDPVMLVASRSIKGSMIITETHKTGVSWISPTGTCFIWELHIANLAGMMGPTGFEPMDPEYYKKCAKRAVACTEITGRYLEDAGLDILNHAAVVRSPEMVLLQAKEPDFIVFNKELNCLEPLGYAQPPVGGE